MAGLRRINADEFERLVYGGRIPFVEPLNEERAAYNEIIRIYALEGYYNEDYEGEPIAPLAGTLRSDVVLTGNLAVPNVVEFNFRTNTVNPGMAVTGNADNRLDDNDAFAIRDVGILFGVKASAAAEFSSAILQLWPNPAAATGLMGGGFGTACEALVRAYNGNMSMDLNAVKYMDKLGMLEFMHSSDAQAGLAVSAGAAPVGVQQANDFGGSKGFKAMVPQLRFAGSDKFSVTVQIPAPLTFVVGTTPVIMSCQLRGLKIQNGGRILRKG